MLKHNRKINRLRGFNYSSVGYYFITICTKNREECFGKVINKQMILNNIGLIVKKYWQLIPFFYTNVLIDSFIIMPNHLHGIIFIKKDLFVGTGQCPVPTVNRKNNYGLLSKIINNFKNKTTKNIRIYKSNFSWQRSFYDHIIRKEELLNKIREYILNNPINWEKDVDNLTSKS